MFTIAIIVGAVKRLLTFDTLAAASKILATLRHFGAVGTLRYWPE